MVGEYVKLGIAVFVFIIGVGSAMAAYSAPSPIAIIVAFVCMGISAAYLPYKWHKLRHGGPKRNDAEILWQAKAENGLLKEDINGKK